MDISKEDEKDKIIREINMKINNLEIELNNYIT